MEKKRKANHLKIVKKKDEGFLYFTTEEAMKTLSIDPRLRQSFINVMKKMEEYFETNKYENTPVYIERLKRHLLSKWGNNIKINIGSTSIGRSSEYGSNNEILINEKVFLNNPERIESILCNNILKVIATADLEERQISEDRTEIYDRITQEQKDEEIYKKGFTYEALAAGMTKEIYPEYGLETPHITMQKFFNRLTGEKNNYNGFLDGKFIARPYQMHGIDYEGSADDFQRDYIENQGYTARNFRSNLNYISMQREIIAGYLFKLAETKGYHAYVHAILALRRRPVKDIEVVNDFLDIVEEELIKKMDFEDKRMAKIALRKMHETRFLIEDLFAIDNAPQEDTTEEQKLEDRTRSLISNLEFGRNAVYTHTLATGNDEMLGEERLEILKKLKQLSHMFGSDMTENLQYLDRIREIPEDIVGLNKYILPNMKDAKGKPIKIYVFENSYGSLKIFDYYQAGHPVENVEIVESDKDEKEILPIVNTASILSLEEINEKSLDKVKERLEKSEKESLDKPRKVAFSKIKINELMNEQGYLSKDEKTRKKYLKSQFDLLSNEEKSDIRREVATENDRFIMFVEGKSLEIGELIEEDGKYKTIKAEKQILIDKSQNGIYDDFYKVVLKQKKKDALGAPDLDLD